MTDVIKTSTDLAVPDECAQRVLSRLDQMSPLVMQSLQGPIRDVMLAAMSTCFTEGSLYGAKKVRDALYEHTNLEQQRREDYRDTLRQY